MSHLMQPGVWITPSSAPRHTDRHMMAADHVAESSDALVAMGGGGDMSTMTLDHAVRVPCALRNAGRRTMYDVLHLTAAQSRGGEVLAGRAAGMSCGSEESTAQRINEPSWLAHGAAAHVVGQATASPGPWHSCSPVLHEPCASQQKHEEDGEPESSSRCKESDDSHRLHAVDRITMTPSPSSHHESAVPVWCDISDFSSDAESDGRGTQRSRSPTQAASSGEARPSTRGGLAQGQQGHNKAADEREEEQHQEQQQRKPGSRRLDDLIEGTYSDEMLGITTWQRQRQRHQTPAQIQTQQVGDTCAFSAHDSAARRTHSDHTPISHPPARRRASPSPTQHGALSQVHTPAVRRMGQHTINNNYNKVRVNTRDKDDNTHTSAESGSRGRCSIQSHGTAYMSSSTSRSPTMRSCARLPDAPYLKEDVRHISTPPTTRIQRAYGKPQGLVLHSLARREAFVTGHPYAAAAGAAPRLFPTATDPHNKHEHHDSATSVACADDLVDQHNPHHRRLLRQLAKSNVTALCVLHHLRESFAQWQLDELPSEIARAAVALQLRVTAVMPSATFHLRGVVAEVQWASARMQAALGEEGSEKDVDKAVMHDVGDADTHKHTRCCRRMNDNAAAHCVTHDEVEERMSACNEIRVPGAAGVWLLLIPEHVITALCMSNGVTRAQGANSRVVATSEARALVGETLYLAKPLFISAAARIILPSYAVTSEGVWRLGAMSRGSAVMRADGGGVPSDETPVRWSWYGRTDGPSTSRTGGKEERGNVEEAKKESSGSRSVQEEDERGEGFPRGPGEEWGVPMHVWMRVRRDAAPSSSPAPRCSAETDGGTGRVLWSSGEEVSPPVTPPMSSVGV